MACVSSAHMHVMAAPFIAQQAPLRSASPPESPRKNPYKLIKELGSGLQGRVVLALDESTKKHVAIKLPTAFSNSPTAPLDERLLDYQNQTIMQERQAHRVVQHDNVVACLRLVPGKKMGRAYVAMVTEYASNGDLFDMIADNGALPACVAKFYFHQLMCGVRACHAAGVVHRDIKPENILFDDNFTLKLCDFGLAMISQDNAHADTMTLRALSGTALYMAPEVMAVKSYRATPVDVWACGVVLFIILTSYPPFHEARAGDYWYDCVMRGRMDVFWASQPKTMDMPHPYAMDLINRMLCPYPEKRITVPEILAHPWLRDVHSISPIHVREEMAHRRANSTSA
jgi:serine/threonine protein kinase